MFLALLGAAANAKAAVYVVSNVISGSGTADALYQNTNNTLLSGGVVAMGYFGSNAYVPSSSLTDIAVTIANFTIVASGIAGSNSATLEGSFAGYVESPGVDTPDITGANPLIGRALYVFVGNGPTLATSTAWALKQVAVIQDDVTPEVTYLANPKGGAAPVIGTIGSFTGNASGIGQSTYTTLKLVAIPEPSVALLGALGALGLLRRRR